MINRKKGVNLVGYSRAEMGIGESCRLAAKSLKARNIPFGIIDFSIGNNARMNDFSWDTSRISKPIFNTNIFHINADQMTAAYNNLGGDFFNTAYNIGYWHWELPEFPDEWCDRFRLVNEVWVPSTFVQKAISKKSTVPVIKIPHCIDFVVPYDVKRARFGLDDNMFLFLMMYDIHSIQERKNPYTVLEAFRHAAKNINERIGLVIKINNSKTDPKQVEELKVNTKNENVFIIDETLSRNETYSLINLCDSYISLHRSEGFGLPLAEAMYLGKPVIGTNWSGNTDFMSSENSLLVDYKLIQLNKDYGPYQAHQIWADPDIEQAAYHMKTLVENQELYNRLGLKGKKTIESNYSPKITGEKISNRLEELGLS